MGLRHKPLVCYWYALRCATSSSVCGNTDEHLLVLLEALLQPTLLALYTRQREKMHGAFGLSSAAAQSGSPDHGSTYGAPVIALARPLRGQGLERDIPTVASKRALT